MNVVPEIIDYILIPINKLKPCIRKLVANKNFPAFLHES